MPAASIPPTRLDSDIWGHFQGRGFASRDALSWEGGGHVSRELWKQSNLGVMTDTALVPIKLPEPSHSGPKKEVLMVQ